MAIRSPDLSGIRIIVPVRDGGARWRESAAALRRYVQSPSTIAVVDSSSTDGSDRVALEHGFELVRIDPRSFNHGTTRQNAVDRFCIGHDFVVFLTHDAVLESPESLFELLSAFDDPSTAAAYGRQLPHHDARPFARHSASYLFPADDSKRRLDDAARYGIRTTHLSNSYAAYRVRALYQAGGFPDRLILGEDAHIALRMLQKGWTIHYRAAATVRHSHDYSVFAEMQRYFDYGVLHAQLPELLHEVGSAEGEGVRFVLSELSYIATAAPWLLPLVPVRNAAKYLGYQLGRHFKQLPNGVRRRLSMTQGFWDPRSIDSP